MTGIATTNPIVATNYTLPASVTNTNPTPITIAVPEPRPSPQLFVVDGEVTSCPDNPGMPSYPTPIFLRAEQIEALRSAAMNTATAFSLNPITAADQARAFNNAVFTELFNQQPANLIEETIVPP
jgi:hypothetical protein